METAFPVYQVPSEERTTLKSEELAPRSKLYILKVDPVVKGGKTLLTELPPLQ